MKSALQFLPMVERADELRRCEPQVHKVAESTTVAFSVFILPTACLAEIRDR